MKRIYKYALDKDRIIAHLMGLTRVVGPAGPFRPDALPQPAQDVLREAEQRLGKRN